MYPIKKLNSNITKILHKIISADIVGNIRNGLKNEIIFDDKWYDCAYISPCGRVHLSSAYCQYLWLIIDVALKKIDYEIIQENCKKQGIDVADYKVKTKNAIENKARFSDALKNFKQHNSTVGDVDADALFGYLNKIFPLLDEDDLFNKLCSEINLAKSLRKTDKIDKDDFKVINFDGAYEQITNAAYCYGIAFCLLHEMSHFELKHDCIKEKMQDEIDADAEAFWNLYNDLEGDELFTAIVGIICVFFSLLLIHPTMEDDNVHPREIDRILFVIDNVKADNYKYIYLVVKLLNYWAKENNVANFPELKEYNNLSIEKIRNFMKNFKRV